MHCYSIYFVLLSSEAVFYQIFKSVLSGWKVFKTMTIIFVFWLINYEYKGNKYFKEIYKFSNVLDYNSLQ